MAFSPLHITPVEAGAALGMRPQTCYNRNAQGTFPLPVRKIGMKPMVLLADLIKYVTQAPESSRPSLDDRAGRETPIAKGRRSNSEYTVPIYSMTPLPYTPGAYQFVAGATAGIACAPNIVAPEGAGIPEQFFEETSDQSQAKATIVSKYFWAWATVMIPTAKKWDNKIAYIDLFAGPGRYKDGTASTPLMVLTQAVEHPEMRNMLVSVFNDVDADHVRLLDTAISTIPGIDKLKYKPKINNEEVGSEIVQAFEKMKFVPTLFFVDPWGYKGLSLRLVNSVLKDWGCECIFFFNYNRISMGLANEKVEEHMNALFGEDRARQLREAIQGLDPRQRELTILEELVSALKDMGGKYVLPFRFKNEKGVRTSHHLIFVSKHPLGYGIMKEIMAAESSRLDAGVPSFEYNPADHRQPRLFEYTRPLDDLTGMLSEHFKGRTLTVRQVFEEHNIDRPYILSNYKAALKKLESAGKVKCDPPAKDRRKVKGEVTMADKVTVTFPK